MNLVIDMWNIFEKTGKVSDYLEYRRKVTKTTDENNKRDCNKTARCGRQ